VTWAEPLVAELEITARVLIPHMPGYGKTAPRLTFDWAAVHQELLSSLGSLGVQRPMLVGFSGGAWRALELAGEPQLGCRGVVCLSGIAALEAAERDGFRQFAQALRSGADLRPLAGPRFLARRVNDPEAVAAVQGWIEAVAPASLAAELDSLASQPDVLPRVGALACPLLVRNGTSDLVCPPAKARAVSDAARDGQLELVEGAGHALMLEDADQTVTAVTRFIAALG
jgi:pimeloyl-ACP methyl ester carboxylesterase